MTNDITFTCWEKDEPIEIQLEPEAIIFKVQPGNEITFKGSCFGNNFQWALRIEHLTLTIQLFPAIIGPFGIEIYENGKLLEDWYKYM